MDRAGTKTIKAEDYETNRLDVLVLWGAWKESNE